MTLFHTHDLSLAVGHFGRMQQGPRLEGPAYARLSSFLGRPLTLAVNKQYPLLAWSIVIKLCPSIEARRC